MTVQADLVSRARRYRFLERVRPAVLTTPFYRLLFPTREVIEHEGLRLSINPGSHLGRSLLLRGAYEPETFEIFRDCVQPGDVLLDVGANEGVFSALASSLVGPAGCVVAVEPQSRLIPIIEENLRLNGPCQTLVAHNALAERDGERMQIALFPDSNTGASSLVRRYRWSTRTEAVETVTPLTLLMRTGRKRFDFVKVDVEGFEPEVVRALPMDKVGWLLLDYHAAILRERGVDPAETDALIRRTHTIERGDILAGYVLYRPL